ncbi:MAG: helix-turn-helix domain-containing protein [Clostridia bacterium]|nr:helix-turn-helix domain-containing protein [Clostridia bacterium]
MLQERKTDISGEQELPAILTKHLKHLRLLCGFSQEQLASELGITRQTVIALETGKRPMTKTMCLALLFVFSRQARANRALRELGLLANEAW